MKKQIILIGILILIAGANARAYNVAGTVETKRPVFVEIKAGGYKGCYFFARIRTDGAGFFSAEVPDACASRLTVAPRASKTRYFGGCSPGYAGDYFCQFLIKRS